MKKVLFLLSFFITLLVTTVSGQNTGGRLDSLSASSAVDTCKFYPGGTLYGLATMAGVYSTSVKTFLGPGILTIDIVSDSLSGSTAGSLYVQYYDGTGTPREKDWVGAGDGTMTTWRGANGTLATATGGYLALDKPISTTYSATRQYAVYTNTTFGHRRWRVIAYCASSTQLTTVGINWKFTPTL